MHFPTGPVVETRRADGAEACLDGLDHPVADVRTADTGVGHSAPSDDLTVMGIDDEAVGTSIQVGIPDDDLALMAAAGPLASVLLKQEAMQLQDPVNPFRVSCRPRLFAVRSRLSSRRDPFEPPSLCRAFAQNRGALIYNLTSDTP